MCALWHWPGRYNLGSRSWHTLQSLTTILWNIIQIQNGIEELREGHEFRECVHCDLDLGDMNLIRGHATHLSHGQQLCEKLSRSDLAVRTYEIDTDFWYMCTVTLTLEVWPWVNAMTLPWVMDNKCVKYNPDITLQWWVMAQARILSIYALWPWPLRYDLVLKSRHIFGSWTTIARNIIQIQQGTEELWPGHWFSVYTGMHWDLALGDMTLWQDNETPLGHG